MIPSAWDSKSVHPTPLYVDPSHGSGSSGRFPRHPALRDVVESTPSSIQGWSPRRGNHSHWIGGVASMLGTRPLEHVLILLMGGVFTQGGENCSMSLGLNYGLFFVRVLYGLLPSV